MRMRTISAIVLSLACISFCMPVKADVQMSDKDKHQMEVEVNEGAKVADLIAKQYKFLSNKELSDRVDRVGQKLADVANKTKFPAGFGNDTVYPFKWTFKVIDDKDINAFSIPGGHVYVNSGLLNSIGTDDELAAVLAHEITHVAHHHMAAIEHKMSKIDSSIILAYIAAIMAHVNTNDTNNLVTGASLYETKVRNTVYGQDAERDADHTGLVIMNRAGYNPVGMLTFMAKLNDLDHRSANIEYGILMDHPYTKERLANVMAQLDSMGIHPTAAEREAISNPLRFTVADAGAGKKSIVYGKTTCATISDTSGTRSEELVQRLNKQLGTGFQFSQVSVSNNIVMISNEPWLTVLPEDLSGKADETIKTVAAQIAHSLQMVLYSRTFVNFQNDTDPKPKVGSRIQAFH